jgi:hypothetical protein
MNDKQHKQRGDSLWKRFNQESSKNSTELKKKIEKMKRNSTEIPRINQN